MHDRIRLPAAMPVTELLPHLKEQGIALINASAISMGLLSSRGPPKWHPATVRHTLPHDVPALPLPASRRVCGTVYAG